MNDYNKNYFWTMMDPMTQEKKYFFKINGMMIEVSKDVYNVCFSSYVKGLRDNRRDEEQQLSSIDYVNSEGHALSEVIACTCDVEREVYTKLMIEQMKLEINKLSDEEKQIAISILLEDKSIRQLALELDIPYMTMKRKKERILKKLKDNLKKW